MVNYEYRNLFYKTHQKKDILIVDSGATVTAVSGEAPSIAGATVEIHTDDVKIESFTLDESICSEEDLKFGLCESSRLGLTIRNRTDIPKLKDFDGYFNVYIYFNGDSDTLFQVGQYICVTDEYTNNRKQRDLEFYDLMHELYDLDITPWYDSYFSDGQRHQIFFAIADLFLWIRGDSPYDSDEDSPHIPVEIDTNFTLTNGDFPFGKNIESDTVTFGFLMEGLLEFNGCFGHMSRDGKFRMILLDQYTAQPVRTVTDEYRIPPTNYDDVATWGIGRINVYSRDNIKVFSHTNSSKKHPSTYVMVDPWILADREKGDTTVQTALERLQIAIYYSNYTPSETECSADLCVEVGDRINIVFGNPAPEDTRSRLRSYVLERHLKGFGSMKDTYTAKGHKKQPKYQIPNERWHNGDSTGSSTQGQGGVSEVDTEEDRKLIAKKRNYGEPMLDEPSAVEVVYNKTTQQVEITWTDPDDISSYTPNPIEWAGTVVVRKESTPPLHPFGNIDSYGGTVLVDETVKDTYKTTAYVDNTIEPNKKYYYAIMPYFIALNDEYHPIKHYRWTKCISVDTERVLMAPTIYPITNIEGTDATIVYLIPHLLDATYTVRKMVGKKNSIPASISDGDIAVDVTESQTIPYVSSVEITGLDENSIYYFVLFVEDSLGATASSEAQEARIGEDLGYNFDYTGEIEEFTVPKTGIYSLETWGSQGGNASDGTNSARGGYGAYAYGEVLLTQGDKLYINVGGQNGYGGGGLSPDPSEYSELLSKANGHNAYEFFWYDLIQEISTSGYWWDNYAYPATNYSWFCYSSGFTTFSYGHSGMGVDYVTASTAKLTLNISGSNNSYTGRIENISVLSPLVKRQGASSGYNTSKIYKNYNTVYYWIDPTDRSGIPNYCEYSGTLEEILTYFCNRFRNINIVVNGTPWT